MARKNNRQKNFSYDNSSKEPLLVKAINLALSSGKPIPADIAFKEARKKNLKLYQRK